MPVWHVSISMKNSKDRPKPYRKLSRDQVLKAIAIGQNVLRGVGGTEAVFTTDPPGACIHIQKPLTPAEIDRLPRGWMDIPAIDERGPVRRIA